jgi:tryptophanyl-tRNA synthetase
MKAATEELLADPAELDRLLSVGRDKAHEVSSATLRRVHQAVGFLPPRV